jgi:hypothetical protein
MSRFFVTVTALIAIAMVSVGCHTSTFTPYGSHSGGFSNAAMVNGSQCHPRDEECLYWYRMALYEQCERARTQKEMYELGAGVGLPIVAGIIQNEAQKHGRMVHIRQNVQRSYRYCHQPPMPPVRYNYRYNRR